MINSLSLYPCMYRKGAIMSSQVIIWGAVAVAGGRGGSSRDSGLLFLSFVVLLSRSQEELSQGGVALEVLLALLEGVHIHESH